MNLPNRLTILRLFLVPVFIIFTVIDNVWTRIFALIIFIAASLTDLYDGYFARKYGEVTVFGEFMDPLADKFLISAAFICFVGMRELHVPAWMVVLIIGREFIITGLRLVAASKGVVIPADRTGKFKTTSQIIAIIVILLILCINSIVNYFYNIEPHLFFEKPGHPEWVGSILMWSSYWLTFITTLLTLISGNTYLRKNWHLFSQEIGSKT